MIFQKLYIKLFLYHKIIINTYSNEWYNYNNSGKHGSKI